MTTLASALFSIGVPLAKKVLQSLGIGVITFIGVDAAINAALAAAKGSFGGLTGEITQIAGLFGVWTALSIVAGGYTAGLSMMMLQRFGKIA